jgi:hypothetical protein
MAWNPSIKNEWDRHQSRFATAWFVTMLSLRKVQEVKDEPIEELREAIGEHSNDENVVAIMNKDAHLLEAALASDLR